MVVSAVAGALAARGRRVDLFGVVVLALVTSLGGGTVRDICLGATPVFWIGDWRYAGTAIVTGVGAFWLLRHLSPLLRLSSRTPALALFTIVGAGKCLAYGTSGLIAVVLGTVTGVAGHAAGRVPNELPLVFRPEIRLNATAAIGGAAVFVVRAPSSSIPRPVGRCCSGWRRRSVCDWRRSAGRCRCRCSRTRVAGPGTEAGRPGEVGELAAVRARCIPEPTAGGVAPLGKPDRWREEGGRGVRGTPPTREASSTGAAVDVLPGAWGCAGQRPPTSNT